jgi:hypothetical protein
MVKNFIFMHLHSGEDLLPHVSVLDLHSRSSLDQPREVDRNSVTLDVHILIRRTQVVGEEIAIINLLRQVWAQFLVGFRQMIVLVFQELGFLVGTKVLLPHLLSCCITLFLSLFFLILSFRVLLLFFIIKSICIISILFIFLC